MNEPHWKGRGIAAAAIARKGATEPKPPQDFIGPAIAALGLPHGTSVAQNQNLLSAIIVAQALDRLGDRINEAAAISQYKRRP